MTSAYVTVEPEPNIPLLRKTWEKINELPNPRQVSARHARKFGRVEGLTFTDKMFRLGINEVWDQREYYRLDCGTHACFAGWAVMLSTEDVPRISSGIAEVATRELGLTYPEAVKLFAAANTRSDIKQILTEICARGGEEFP